VLAQPLRALDEDYEVGIWAWTRSCARRTVVAAARDAALRLDWKAAANSS